MSILNSTEFGRPLLHKGYMTLPNTSFVRVKETKDFFFSVSSVAHLEEKDPIDLERNLLPSYFLPGVIV